MRKCKKAISTVSGLFFFNSTFWILLFIFMGTFGNYFDGTRPLTYRDPDTGEQVSDIGVDNIQGNGWSFFSNSLLIFRIMVWQVPETMEIPQWVSLLLDLFALYSLFIFMMWVRGTGT